MLFTKTNENWFPPVTTGLLLEVAQWLPMTIQTSTMPCHDQTSTMLHHQLFLCFHHICSATTTTSMWCTSEQLNNWTTNDKWQTTKTNNQIMTNDQTMKRTMVMMHNVVTIQGLCTSLPPPSSHNKSRCHIAVSDMATRPWMMNDPLIDQTTNNLGQWWRTKWQRGQWWQHTTPSPSKVCASQVS